MKIAEPYVSPKITEQFKGEVQLKEVTFPKDLGEEHPFNFKECGEAYTKVGLAKAAVDKHIDFLVSPGLYVKSDVKKAEVLIQDFIEKIGFDQILRNWIQEALVKGNGFIELGMTGKDIQIKVINANQMYVRRNKKGEVLGYCQYIGGDLGRYDPKKVIEFQPYEIAHLSINKAGDSAYGLGLIYPALNTLNNILRSEKDMHILISRKANAPIHAKLGSPEEPATQSDVTTMGQKFEYLHNQHEWATDHRVDMKVIEFGNLGDKFTGVLEHDKEVLFYIFQIPPVIMGLSSVPEGLAKAQMDAFERRIQSLQSSIERVIEEQIFRPILNMNGIDAHVEIEWGQPSADDINARVDRLTKLLQLSVMSPQLRAMLEIDLAKNLGYEEVEKILVKPEEAPEIEREKEKNLGQPEIPGEKESFAIQESPDLKLTEWLNFDYQGYKNEVLDVIRTDEFRDLRGRNARDYALGKLNAKEINVLKAVLMDNFERNGTIKEISEDLKTKIQFKDRVLIQDGIKFITLTKESRPLMIARTESTRVAAQGVLNNYGKKGVEQVRFLASISERTCPQCESLNGNIYSLNEAREMVPLHTGCRCSWVAL